MTLISWVTELYELLNQQQIIIRNSSEELFPSLQTIEIDSKDWHNIARLCQQQAFRWSGCWADQNSDGLLIYALLEKEGFYLLITAILNFDEATLPSQSQIYPAADRAERHIQDLWGIEFTDAVDNRRWTRHLAWDDKSFPMREEFELSVSEDHITEPDNQYPFKLAKGSGVYEIPVGPVHAGIIEPGHFRFNAVGEDILNLEEHLGYVHKGIEKIAVGKDLDSLVKLSARLSGDSAVSHSWALCKAIENAYEIKVGDHIHLIRGILSERERVANHIGDIGAICNDVGFAFANAQCSALRELWQRTNAELFGHRLLMDTLVIGGVSSDIEEDQSELLKNEIDILEKEIKPLFNLLIDIPSLEDRLLKAGYLSGNTAMALGCTGYVAKASGINNDVRAMSHYAPYDKTPIEVPVLETGDVMSRVQIRMKEIKLSLQWMRHVLLQLKPGSIQSEIQFSNNPVQGIGIVEGWRGETFAFIRLDENQKVLRYFPRDPSWLLWPALEKIVMGNIVPDFPVCNKSVNGSYSGQDL